MPATAEQPRWLNAIRSSALIYIAGTGQHTDVPDAGEEDIVSRTPAVIETGAQRQTFGKR
jgi:hypothetical protein